MNDLIFPGARHTRFEHAVGTFRRASAAAQIQRLTPAESRLVQAFALLHDIGHGPFSHQVEPVLDGDHHHRGKCMIHQMAPELAACGMTPENLCEMMDGINPLAQWVSDRNLGADKLDYLQRDAYHIGFTGVPDLEVIQQRTARSTGGFLALHEKFIEDGKRLQKFYSYLHQHGYLNKTALIAQRMLQRALHGELLEAGSGEGACCLREACWKMDDAALMNRLLNARSETAVLLAQKLQKRQLHRTVLCIKPQGYAYVENTVGKEIAVEEWTLEELAAFSGRVSTMEEIAAVEQELAEAAGIPGAALLLVAMPYFTKLLPRDLRIANGGENDYWLFDKDRDHRASMESDYLRTFAVRIAVAPEYRTGLFGNHSRLSDILRKYAQ